MSDKGTVYKYQTTRIYHFFEKYLRMMEFDRAVFFGLLSKIWMMIALPITAVLIAYRFTPELQGYYYTFDSLLKLQIFVELGLGIVIVQFASHEWSKLSLNENGEIVGDQDALSRLINLAHISIRWYAAGGLIFVLSLGIFGYLFFSSSSHEADIKWIGPWFLLCLFTGLSVCLLPIWSLLEGCNQVANVNYYRLVQGMLAYFGVWAAILFGANLWTASVFSAVSLLWGGFFLRKYYARFLKTLLFYEAVGPKISWNSEIWPMQWRIALSWISGYFVFSFFTPVLFKYQGPIVAGQMGMTWSVVGALSAVASAWILPKAPRFGILIAKKEYRELDRLFWRLTRIVVGVVTILCLVLWLGVYILNKIDYPIASRILPPLPTGLFMLATTVTVFSLPISTYLRAHKKEPLLILSLAQGILVGLSTLFLSKYYSATGVAAGYLIINLLLTPFVALTWNRCRKEWHADYPLSERAIR